MTMSPIERSVRDSKARAQVQRTWMAYRHCEASCVLRDRLVKPAFDRPHKGRSRYVESIRLNWSLLLSLEEL